MGLIENLVCFLLKHPFLYFLPNHVVSIDFLVFSEIITHYVLFYGERN